MLGNGAANILVGGNADDVLNGRGGNDILDGGDDADTLTGGGGADRFILEPGASYNSDWPGDVITDFTRGEDRLEIPASWFHASISSEFPEFRVELGTELVSTGSGPMFLFETDASRLWYDADGAGGEESLVLIATLEGVTTLAVTDFIFPG